MSGVRLAELVSVSLFDAARFARLLLSYEQIIGLELKNVKTGTL